MVIADVVLLLDRRHGSEPDGLTRQIVGRGLASGEQLWLRPSSGVLGGYLGTSPAGVSFGVAAGPEADIDRVVRLDATSGLGTLAPEEPLWGATGDSRSLVTDELIVVPSRSSSIVAFDGTNVERRWVRELDYPLRSASRTSLGLLVAVGDPDYFCN